VNSTENKELICRETFTAKSLQKKTKEVPISIRKKKSKQTSGLARTLSSAQQWSY
jgi:hypothetical protein